jgi:hypothetical protein
VNAILLRIADVFTLLAKKIICFGITPIKNVPFPLMFNLKKTVIFGQKDQFGNIIAAEQ